MMMMMMGVLGGRQRGSLHSARVQISVRMLGAWLQMHPCPGVHSMGFHSLFFRGGFFFLLFLHECVHAVDVRGYTAPHLKVSVVWCCGWFLGTANVQFHSP